MKALFDSTSYECSQLITKRYSTSFSMGILLFKPSIRPAIYAIYGFVRYADEIVDTFLEYPQQTLLDEFEEEYYKALDRKISLNPILNAFQEVALRYDLQPFVKEFLKSMRRDLSQTVYATQEEYEAYIYGSADVVGLMCLRVFVNNNEQKFQELKPYAMKLGSAFQKVNFLRDLKDDLESLERSYFPNLTSLPMDAHTKQTIILDIENDFNEALIGIQKLPIESKMGVYLAYKYYLKLLYKLKKTTSEQIMNERIRVSNPTKILILMRAYTKYSLRLV
ncbi:squalene/phytoene synthase family protein [Wenyingzhuangia sp. 2_MG-2023]|uniref:phytoene/squalene synthase family protein n=1 Tax=Wenyingzhuangia sp. 2_MG-2023 TaxID=3062639 RepID=UPI0026E3EFB4|nr:squalene/phytoene synthase family protein [Wenyingzhuangia sp. 2_MG-2023]MDO6737167.1 squalene/phytoene synthase family protein [Wenyingzhuangia sp. 2_MG-2023]